jgi:putative ATPase
MKSFGYGEGYKYAHDYKGHFAGQRNLPEELGDKRFYEPGELGYEATVKARLEAWWKMRKGSDEGGPKA